MSPLIMQGLDLVIYGMGTVFVFLTVLVIATSAMSRLARLGGAAGGESGGSGEGEDPALIAAIGAAVKQFRRSRY